MRELAILTFQSLDGIMQAPSSPDEDRSGGFKLGGWAQPYWQEVMEQVMKEAMSSPYDLLLGRKTYDIFASHFPEADENNPVAEMLNKATKYVVTSSPEGLKWQNTKVIHGAVAKEIAALKMQDGPLLQVHGSWELIRELLAHNLIDEFRLWTFPVILGTGKRLFEKVDTLKSLKLVKSDPCPCGAFMAIFRSS